ncbi:MAG: lysophospholipid acyltransferase family protein [Verrucomicrobiota bacterium]
MKRKIVSAVLVFLIRLVCGAVVRKSPRILPDGPLVFFSNHTSNLDFPVIWAGLPPTVRSRARPIAASDYWDRGRLRSYLARNVFKAILIERRAVTRDNNPMEAMQAALKEGGCLIVFPEGTRSRSGDLGSFKAGISHLAQLVPSVPFVPVYLENLFRILPKGERFPLPLVATLAFGEPLFFDEAETKETFLTRATDALIELSDSGSREGLLGQEVVNESN